MSHCPPFILEPVDRTMCLDRVDDLVPIFLNKRLPYISGKILKEYIYIIKILSSNVVCFYRPIDIMTPADSMLCIT